jgi:hypothetical protein
MTELCYAPAELSWAIGEERARSAWKRYCNREGLIYQEPGSVDSVPFEGGYKITLSNARGNLAIYSFKRWRLRRLWPNTTIN